MWYLAFLVIVVGAAIADHNYAWQTGNEYHFLIESRTLTSLNRLSGQSSGIFMKCALTIQVKSSDRLQAVVSETQHAPVDKVLTNIWEEITDLEFRELSLSEKPFEIKLKHGMIRDVLVDEDVPTWEVNLLKSIVSQLQIDMEGENMLARSPTYSNEIRGMRQPYFYMMPYDNVPNVTFKVMEDSVGGKCEVLYNITPMNNDTYVSVPPYSHENDSYFTITKSKDYVKCEQRMAYEFGIMDKRNLKRTPNVISRSSETKIVATGNLTCFTIQSSSMTDEISINSNINDMYSGVVYSSMNLTLDRMSQISNPLPSSNNLVSTGNLVYTYNNPFSNQRKPRRSSVSRRTLESENHNSNSSSDDNSSEERDYLQPKPTLDEAPESPLLPYFIGYKGNSIQKSEEDYILTAARLIGQITGEMEHFPEQILNEPFTDTLERVTILIRLIRTMNVNQIAEIENKLPELFYQDDRNRLSNKEEQKVYDQAAWDVFCSTVAYAGTGPALIAIKNWIKTGKLEGKQAAQIISKIPKAAIAPTAEYIAAFFELITDKRVMKQKYLNTTAPLSFAELVGYTQNITISSYYPIHSFDRMVPKDDNSLLEIYIPYMATQLRKSIEEGDSRRIQTYIMSLGNFDHPEVVFVFKPYLEGTLPASKFQRLMMLISLSRLSESHPLIIEAITYKIYQNVHEAYELRIAAVNIIMRTKPSLNILERIAELTMSEDNLLVKSAVKTNLEAIANLKQPEWEEFASKARIASKLLNPDIQVESQSESVFKELIVAALNIAQTNIRQTIGSDDIDIPKDIEANVHQSYGDFHLPRSKIRFSVSSIRKILIDMGQHMPWKTKSIAEKKSIIEEIIEKLGIIPEDEESFEGNIFIDTIFDSEFYPFDSHTIEDVKNMMATFIESMSKTQAFESENLNQLGHYDTTLGFPTETGLPFIYTLTIPQLTKYSGGESHEIRNSQTGSFMEFTAAGHIIMREKIQSRIGFVTPFEHRHYIADIDINIQIFIPAGLSVKLEGGKKKLELNMQPREYYRYGTGHVAIHHSIVPYTARHNILDLQPVILSSNTRLVYTKEPREIQASLGNLTLKARSDLIDREILWSESNYENTMRILYLFYNDPGAHYRTFDGILNVTAAQVNITFNNFVTFNEDNSEATIPAIIDKEPESDARKEQFQQEVSKNINSGTGFIFDISILANNFYQVFTFALANSRVDNKYQGLLYSNIQSPNGEIYVEFCSVGYVRLSRIPLNLEKAIEMSPNYEFKTEMRLGDRNSYGATFGLRGNWTRSNDVIERASKSEIFDECRQEMAHGNVWVPACQRASELFQHKDLLTMSISTDAVLVYYMYMMGPIVGLATKLEKLSNENITTPEFFTRPGSAHEGTIDMEIKMSLDNNDAKISVNTSQVDVGFSLSDINQDTFKFSDTKEYFDGNSEGEVCVLDKTKVITFDKMQYHLNLGKCWHVMMIIKQKRDIVNPEKTLNIPNALRVLVMVREMDDGSREVRMILDDQEIYLQKSDNRLQVMVNGQAVNFSDQESYRDFLGEVEIYQMDGMIAISSELHDLFAVYDGERILLNPSDAYLNAVRGLCGNYDKLMFNDFITSKNCNITRPEIFAATYALTEEDCQGPALQNKQQVDQYSCIPMPEYSPTKDIIDHKLFLIDKDKLQARKRISFYEYLSGIYMDAHKTRRR
ncbi:PREDICTED: vitellogenin-1-like [Wasmannia auropunctata]|uniref:vitellogenin-1-like n=1 Tax=Wasmannia auropunctata TaxID=64793 RepID=UPI0005EFA60F|nr:PREDICTED: vitellogenin-1-like [Wasmannia auropunctata]